MLNNTVMFVCFFFFTFTVFLYIFRTGWSIIRRIKYLITNAPFPRSLMCRVWPLVSDTNGHARHINDRGNGARGCICNQIFDSPDDGPAGLKHVEKNCKCKKKKENISVSSWKKK